MNTNAIYFPGLNGLRAIASIAVVISHITLDLKEFNLDPHIFGTFDDGKPQGLSLAGYGVSIFFVLSGFLITYLLQVEKGKQSIDIKKFYFRRILRIWPLYYLYLVISVVVIICFGLGLNVQSFFLYFFYAANVPFIIGTGLPFLSHYWSLGVEEQFYLFWPWVNKKLNSVMAFSILAVLILLGTKILLHLITPHSLMESIIHVTRFHCMLIGAIAALLYKNRNPMFLYLVDNKITQSIAWFLLFLVAINKFHVASFVDNEIISIVAVCLIIGQINVKNRIINLDVSIMDVLGRISYGIYVIHPLLIFFSEPILKNLTVSDPVKYLLTYSIILSATIFLAHLSYTYFESYFLKYKVKFEVVKSSATKQVVKS